MTQKRPGFSGGPPDTTPSPVTTLGFEDPVWRRVPSGLVLSFLAQMQAVANTMAVSTGQRTTSTVILAEVEV